MNDILNSRAFGRAFNNPALEMVKRQERINKMLGLSAGNEFYQGVKSMQEKVMGNAFSSANSIIRMGQAQQVWQKQMGQLASIATGLGAHTHSINEWKSLTTQISASHLFGPNEALKRALGGIAYELSNHILTNRYSELALQIGQLGKELTGTNALVYEEEEITPEKINDVQTIILNAFERSKHLPKKAKKLFQDFVYLIGAILAIYELSNLAFGPTTKETVEQVIDEKDILTSQQLQQFLSEFYDNMQRELISNGDSIMLERETMVKIKPRKNAGIIEFLPACTNVSKLDTYKKWAYVGYKSPMDSLVQHGWVLKKYLRKPKQKEIH